jgi:hypothetical protein
MISADLRSVDLFSAKSNGAIELGSSVIVEIAQGVDRSIYYVHPEPVCTFRPIHVERTRVWEPRYDESYSVEVNLTDQGMREWARCRTSSRPENGADTYLVAARGELVGVSLGNSLEHEVARKNGLEFSAIFFHGSKSIVAIDRALSSDHDK